MQAIQTKYLPATDRKESRIKAWCEAGSVTIGYPHEFSSQAVHRAAATELVKKLGWDKPIYSHLLGGALPQNTGGYCFIFDNDFAKD